MNFYLIFKSLHLIAVISWMAGLLYLPRIFVYHTENSSNIEICKVFKVMEKNYISTLCIQQCCFLGYLVCLNTFCWH